MYSMTKDPAATGCAATRPHPLLPICCNLHETIKIETILMVDALNVWHLFAPNSQTLSLRLGVSESAGFCSCARRGSMQGCIHD